MSLLSSTGHAYFVEADAQKRGERKVDSEMKTRPNDPCWCDSGQKYKKCHKAFDEAPEDQKYREAQKAYAAIWRNTSERQFNRGDYDWMASQLGAFDIQRVFDVGCGSGHGLLALTRSLSPEFRIIAIDENLACLTIAKETLSNGGQC
jgi:ubiquinone/menaquinone biosynthesis C-methylase UbiE